MLRFLTAGESHGPAETAILEGIPAGLHLTATLIDRELARRQKGYKSGGRMKIETDTVEILSGVMEEETTGGPIAVLVRNQDHDHWKGKPIHPMTAPRPGHADLTGVVKYAYKDLRPALERASARETVMRVAMGAICKNLLACFGVQIGGYVVSIGPIHPLLGDMPYWERCQRAEESDVRCPDASGASLIRGAIDSAIRAKDTLGGVLEIMALNLPPGLGSFAQWDQRLDARLAMAVMSVQAMKGVEIGDAFANTQLPGTQAQDAIRVNGDALVRLSNRAGGVEGGISNGQPIVVRVAMKPIATTLAPQPTVDLVSGKEVPTRYERSDFCPVPRAVPVLEAMVGFVIAGALLEKIGGDSVGEMQSRFEKLRRMTLQDFQLDNIEHIWWK